MKNKKLDTRRMATLAMLAGLLLAMSMTGIGFIPLPIIKATTMHIPVILGAVLLGPTAGAFLGAVFGICSIWANTVTPGLLSFAFSPFMTNEGFIGVVKSLWISLGCRILLGAMAGWLWKGMKASKSHDFVALPVTAALASIFHSLIVMASIGILLAQQYAEVKNVGMTAVLGTAMLTVVTSGIPEAIAAVLLVTVIGKALLKLLERMKKH